MVALGGIPSIGGIRGTSTASRSAASVAARLKDDAAALQFDHSWLGKSASIGNALQYILKIGWFSIAIGMETDGELADLRVTSLFFQQKSVSSGCSFYISAEIYKNPLGAKPRALPSVVFAWLKRWNGNCGAQVANS